MNDRRRVGPVGSYEEYLKRYPRPGHDSSATEIEEDPADAAEKRGRDVLRQAAAGLLAQVPEPPSTRSRSRSRRR